MNKLTSPEQLTDDQFLELAGKLANCTPGKNEFYRDDDEIVIRGLGYYAEAIQFLFLTDSVFIRRLFYEFDSEPLTTIELRIVNKYLNALGISL